LGKQQKEYYNTFKSGKCPTCGHDIDNDKINESKEKMMFYAEEWKKLDSELNQIKIKYNNDINIIDTEISEIKSKIFSIDSEINVYNNNLKLLNENYDNLILDNENKIKELEEQINKSDIEIGEWNEMNELFSKTLRYNLLNSLIPQINSSIQYFINKLELDYSVSFDQEFKSHIFDGVDIRTSISIFEKCSLLHGLH
jgi:DNA repair exonuclease SbcCD ATPase subunit